VTRLQDLGITRGFSPVSSPVSAELCWQSEIQVSYSAMTSGALNLGGQTADWVLEAAKKLERLGRLRPGWDSYGGLALKPVVKDLTIQVLTLLRKDELPVPAVVLGSAGTVQLEWRGGGKELDLELLDNNTFEYVTVSRDGTIEEGEEGVNLPGKLRDLTAWLQGF
jgi:hypothetical protein